MKESIPTIKEKASERKECPYCNTGRLHRHVVQIDKGIIHYIKSLGEFKEETKEFKETANRVFKNCSPEDNLHTVKEAIHHAKQEVFDDIEKKIKAVGVAKWYLYIENQMYQEIKKKHLGK